MTFVRGLFLPLALPVKEASPTPCCLQLNDHRSDLIFFPAKLLLRLCSVSRVQVIAGHQITTVVGFLMLNGSLLRC